MNPELEVSLCGEPVGHLVEVDRRQWSFVYSDAALHKDNGGPIGLALPRTRADYRGDTVHAVFANLLPDGSLRQRLAQSLGLSEDNEFALLSRLGGECAGGLSVRVPGQPAPELGLSRDLDDEQLRNLVAVLPLHPLLADAEDLRKTLPGEFDKLPVSISEGRISVVLDDALTSHIIKPAKPQLRESVVNEAWCMQLAQRWGLPVARTELRRGRVNLLEVERIDRRPGEVPGAVHMEDFCQVMGLPPNQKYEREGGPRLADLAGLLRRYSARPAVDIRALLHWTLFSFLIGFGAQHGKQLAVLHHPRGPRLAPFFGLWSTHVYAEMNFRLGFSVGQEDRPDWLTAQRWRELAASLGVRPRYVLEQLNRAATELPSLAAQHADDFQRRHGRADIIRQIRALLEQRCRQALVSLAAEPDPPRRVTIEERPGGPGGAR